MSKKISRSLHSSNFKSNLSAKGTSFDYNPFKEQHLKKMMVLAGTTFFLLLIVLFKNISYPLFWADESMTAIGSERVIEFGFPKVHDGKNVFYDLRHTNPTLGISKNDAYIGGTGWGHYYYGVLGYKLAEKFDNIYSKTGIYRASFAILGLMGLLLLSFLISRFWGDKFSRYAFFSLFFLFELLSVSLLLLMREVRYYSIVLFLCSAIVGLYATYRFRKPFNKIAYVSILSVLLWMLFNTFAPVYFILILSIGVSETVIGISQYFKKKELNKIIAEVIPAILPLLISLVFIYPLIGYFKTFEISKAMEVFNGYSDKMYRDNVSTVMKYFKDFELFGLAVVLKAFVALNYKKVASQDEAKFKLSNFLTLLFIIFVFAIAKIPNFIYTRYIIYLQPFLCIIIILDLFSLLKIFSAGSRQPVNSKMLLIGGISLFLIGYSVKNNAQYLSGYMHQISEPYKGPLDYTIPYIREKYPKSDTLIIAANYEETSYMYYLKSKVVLGFIGNNLDEDAQVQPHIIAYRKPWGNFVNIIQGYMQKEPYEKVSFPIKDNAVNNIPELNFMPAFNHQFYSSIPKNEAEQTELYLINGK